jgi:hypothetical protein
MKFTFFEKNRTIDDLAVAEAELERKRSGALAALSQAEEEAGRAFLDGQGEASVDNVLRRRVEVEAIDRAIGAIRRQRPTVLKERAQEEARTARVAAEAKRGELDSIERKKAKLLQQLSEIEGAPGVFVSIAEGFPVPEIRSQTLTREIGNLQQRAADLNSRNAPDAGCFDSEDVAVLADDSVIMAVLKIPAIGPSATDVRAWLAAVEGQVPAGRVERGVCETIPRRVRVEWRGGRIDGERSYIFYPELSSPLMSIDGARTELGLNVRTGTFRAAEAA